MISRSATRRLLRPPLVAQQQARRNRVVVGHEGIIRKFSSNNSAKNGGFLDNITGSLSNFRLKAANALTSSLPEDERSQLLTKFQPPQQKNIESDETEQEEKEEEDNAATVAQISIDEAVAAARAQEAARHTKKWETEKEKLIQEAENAARARVESDIAIQKRQIAFEAWKKDLERAKAEKTTTKTTSTSNPEEESEEEERASEDQNEHEDVHPILGPVVVDLGSKRVHIADIQSLASIPVWKKQRTYRHDRAKTMANDKLKTLHLGLPGVIGIFEAKNGTLSIIDGQHRLGMLRVLQDAEGASDNFDFGRILVEVYPQRDDQDETAHAKDIFLEVNKAEPVKLVDLPGVASSKDRKVINEGASMIQDKFPDMFSPSQRCRSPHLNIDNLRDALFASNVLGRHKIKTPKALEAWLIGQNEILSAKFQEGGGDKEAAQHLGVSSTALKKAIKFDFYLGLDSSWLYN